MKFEDLLKFIEIEEKRLEKYHGKYSDPEKEVFACTLKLSEEQGELCDAVLSYYSLQRKSKKYKKDYLENEFADVIIATLFLAKQMNIDIKKALTNKIKKINRRHRGIKPLDKKVKN